MPEDLVVGSIVNLEPATPAPTRHPEVLVPALAGLRATPHYLGHCYSGRRQRSDSGVLVPVLHHVYVVWLDGVDADHVDRALLAALGRLHVHKWPCPQCGRVWALDRPGGCIVSVMLSPPRVVKVSDTCPQCAANVHLDATPVDRRPRLKWIRMYQTSLDEGAGRATRYPQPW